MKIAILGGGISGLSAAWYAKKRYPHARIQLFEQSNRLGGVVDSGVFHGLLYEKGPRTFVFSRSSHLLELLEDLGMSHEIFPCSSLAKKRYLWHRGKLRGLSSFMVPLIFGLLKELFVSSKDVDDESVYDFALRKFNRKVAELLLDPMALGIYAADIRQLSLKSSFPFLYEWDRQGISLLRAFASSDSSKKKGLFTLQRGLFSLIETLKNRMDLEIFYETPVTALMENGVVAGGSFFPADMIVSALPGAVLGNLSGLWQDFSSTSLWVVQCAFERDVLLKNGFGYLIPTMEKESVLGCVFDSSIFPRAGDCCFLTVMLRNLGDASWAEKEALLTLKKHLKIEKAPIFISSYLAKDAIPFFKVGYAKRLSFFLQDLKIKYPRLHVCGNYVDGVSVDSCIHSSQKIFIN